MFNTFHSKSICRQKLYQKKGKKVMFNGSNCDSKSQLSRILTEPLNPRDAAIICSTLTGKEKWVLQRLY